MLSVFGVVSAYFVGAALIMHRLDKCKLVDGPKCDVVDTPAFVSIPDTSGGYVTTTFNDARSKGYYL